VPDANAAVLLDVDGTLVDSNYLHVLAWARSFAEHGIRDVPMAAIHHCIGMGSSELLETLIGSAREDVNDGHSRHFAPLREEIGLLPGARDLLFALSQRGFRVVLATSAKPEDLDALRRTLDADAVIDHITSSKDVAAAKPAPDLFAVAHQAAGLPPERCIAVGDTVWDVRSANGAGVACVCVTTGGISESELRSAGAAAVYSGADQLLARLDESPIGELLRT
jgi:HAD superfamily hydrolase (TIGR01509 family)